MSTILFQRSRELIQNGNLTDEQVRNLLAPVKFANWQGAYQNLLRLAEISPQAKKALADGLPSLLMALAGTATPNRVLVNFERFVLSAEEPTQLLRYLATNPRGFEILVTLFVGSQFLTEILLRHPRYFTRLTDHKSLAQTKTLAHLQAEALAVVEPFFAPIQPNLTPALDALRRFQRQELLRIGTCDLLGLLDMPSVTLQLSHLADSLAQAALSLAAHQTETNPQGFAVLGMGKLGGEELNYSSDIDLIFLADEEPNRFVKMGQLLIDILSRSTNEGFLYRVDMRLRPWGRSGALVNSVEGHLTYLHKHANLWERQALLKARTIAGSPGVGGAFLAQSRPIIFGHDDDTLRQEIHRLKQRIEGQLRQGGRTWGEVKLGRGSIRDIEFVTQYLQLAHGPGQPDSGIDSATTLTALAGLSNTELLPQDEFRVLTDGYVFLRTVEHHLQLMHYRQTHTLPKEPEALSHLAKRLGYTGADAGERFTAQYQQHSAVIRAVYQRHLANEQPDKPQTSPPDVLPLLVRMHPTYATTFSDADIENHARLLEALDANRRLVQSEAVKLPDGMWQVTVVGYDNLGVLSLICGLLVVFGLDIVNGQVFTYGPAPNPPAETNPIKAGLRRLRNSFQPKSDDSRRKIVDVFTVKPVELGLAGKITPETWQQYDSDLTALFDRLHRGEQREVQGELAKRVVLALPHHPSEPKTLYPVDLKIDNEISERHTVLRIDALDTFGFLYELTNALALAGINVRNMTVASQGPRVRDTLYVTDLRRNKITSEEKQRELRVATVLIKHFTHLLPQSPNPEAALLHFRDYIGQLFTRPNWPDEITSLEQPDVLSRLARLLGVSDFLWKDFLRMQHTNLYPVVRDSEGLAERVSKSSLREDLAIILNNNPKGDPQRAALNAFKDREMFRIDMRQIQGHIDEFGLFAAELTDLAEVIVEAAYYLVDAELRATYGIPQLENGRRCPLSVGALGKCGGRELGFASDIELMFIFGGNGRTTGPRSITTAEYFTKLVQEVNQSIQTKREGIFELDLRLRPYGNAGSMAVSLESFQNYFGPSGDAWPYERQALVKLRPIAGDLKFGQQIVRLRDELIYTGEPFDAAAMRAMRERQIRHLVQAGTIHAKFSPGGLVDAEYLVQGLQITYGHLYPSLRNPNTRATMQAMAAIKILPPEDYPRLLEAYNFLRILINALRMVRGNAKDLTLPPPDDEAFAFLARRLNYGSDLIRLQNDLYRHMMFIQKLSQRLLG